MLKKVFRDVVLHQYDDVKSVVRLEATYSGIKKLLFLSNIYYKF